jgi:hypothetical protein
MTELQKLSVLKAVEGQALEASGALMAGKGADQFRDAGRFVSQYGGHVDDYAKMSSSSYKASDTLKIETHWVENVKTGERFDAKIVKRSVKS